MQLKSWLSGVLALAFSLQATASNVAILGVATPTEFMVKELDATTGATIKWFTVPGVWDQIDGACATFDPTSYNFTWNGIHSLETANVHTSKYLRHFPTTPGGAALGVAGLYASPKEALVYVVSTAITNDPRPSGFYDCAYNGDCESDPNLGGVEINDCVGFVDPKTGNLYLHTPSGLNRYNPKTGALLGTQALPTNVGEPMNFAVSGSTLIIVGVLDERQIKLFTTPLNTTTQTNPPAAKEVYSFPKGLYPNWGVGYAHNGMYTTTLGNLTGKVPRSRTFVINTDTWKPVVDVQDTGSPFFPGVVLGVGYQG